eukprot:1327582-Amphidinium_carterae.1
MFLGLQPQAGNRKIQNERSDRGLHFAKGHSQPGLLFHSLLLSKRNADALNRTLRILGQSFNIAILS